MWLIGRLVGWVCAGNAFGSWEFGRAKLRRFGEDFGRESFGVICMKMQTILQKSFRFDEVQNIYISRRHRETGGEKPGERS